MKKIVALTIMLAMGFAVSSARAATVYNLSKQPEQIEVEEDHRFTPITIAPGDFYRITGDAEVKFGERKVLIHYYEEYAIWGPDSFGPQRRNQEGNLAGM